METKRTYICGVCKKSYDVKLECELCEKHHAEIEEWKMQNPPKFKAGDIVAYRSREDLNPWICRICESMFFDKDDDSHQCKERMGLWCEF